MNFTALVGGRWVVHQALSSGAFGLLFTVRDENQNDAILKLDQLNQSTVRREARIYEQIGAQEGIPRVYFSGLYQGRNALVLQRLWKDLNSVRSERGGTFSEVDILKVGIRVLRRIETIHNKGIIHADLHPANIMTGRTNRGRLYLIDFGSSSKFRDRRGEHVRRTQDSSGLVQYEFCSINVQQLFTPSRRDDIISLVYTLIHLRRGHLPWSSEDSDINMDEVLARKQSIRASELCHGLPNGIEQLYRKACNLSFSERPDYSRLRAELRSSLERRGSSENSTFEWQR